MVTWCCALVMVCVMLWGHGQAPTKGTTMNLPIVSTATLLQCGQCDDNASRLLVNGGDATCTTCGDVKYIAHDIAPHVESTEVLVITTAGHLGVVDLAAFDTDN